MLHNLHRGQRVGGVVPQKDICTNGLPREKTFDRDPRLTCHFNEALFKVPDTRQAVLLHFTLKLKGRLNGGAGSSRTNCGLM